MAKTGKTILGTYFARGRVNKYQQIFILGWLILGLGIALGFSSETAPGNPGVNESPDIFEQAAAKMSDNNPAVRRTGITELIKTGNPKAVPALIKALEDSDAAVRLAAIEGLTGLKSPDAFEALAGVAKSDKERELREAAIVALGTIDRAGAIPVFAGRLDDADIPVRLAAVRELGKSRAEESVSPLAEALKKTSDPVLEKPILEALGRIGSAGGIAVALEKLGKSRSVQVQVEAISALEKMVSGLEVISLLEQKLKAKDAKVRAAAAFSLARLGNYSGLPVCLKLLSSKNRRARYRAVEALGEMKDISAIGGLEKAFEKENDPAVKRKIQASLSKLKAFLTEENEIK